MFFTVHRLIYGSRVTPMFAPLPAAEIDRILAASVRNNAAVGVTGMLLHHRDVFVQVLEGDRAAVEAVYARVAGDPRHCDVRLVSAAPAAERLFGEWSMCAATLGPAEAHLLEMMGATDDLQPEALDVLPTLNLLSAVAQLRRFAQAA